ncbi:hypothetical protein HELRODRAFT_177781 [Helobdella robusta]|uniref:C-type lectin domain-containing protein n=1 Tax=Helobdella robusta TaxID=6412 RepID=T1FC91_HELRO|nr:hypothetical protein HELRODRAFT_177781 [Helobdella robusta]ESN97721.1 hypothetical protein HELRODRAFT_177781 [Helobdella robusta]
MTKCHANSNEVVQEKDSAKDMGEIQTVFQASLLLVGLFGCTGEGACPDPFTLIGGRCIYVNTTGASWDASVIACDAHGANLVIADNQEFLNQLTLHLDNKYMDKCVYITACFWTAGRKKNNSQVFEWKLFRTAKFLDEILQYKSVTEMNNWCSGQPDNWKGKEDCMELNRSNGKFLFNDLLCAHLLCSVCQFDG